MASFLRFIPTTYSWSGVVLFTVLWRLASYAILMVDPDEWTYWVMASEWTKGARLYTDVVDIKPPGIFLVFAFLQKFSLDSIVVARVLGSAMLGTGAWALGNLCARCFDRKLLSWMCALLFVVAFSFPFGLALNTELFFVSFICLGLYLLQKGMRWQFFGSLVLGLAFLIKYTLAGDLFFACWLVAMPFVLKNHFTAGIRHLFILGLGVGLPMLLTILFFWLSGQGEELKYALVELPGNYSGTGTWKARIDLLALFHFRFFWLAIPAYLGLKELYPKNKNLTLGIVLWMFLNWIMVAATGKLHDHYWLQLMPPYAMAAAWFYASRLENKVLLKRYSLQLMALVFIAQSIWTLKQLWKADFSLRRSVSEVAKWSNEDSKIWYAGLPAVYYGQLNQRCKSPFVHGSLMFEQKHIEGFNIDIPGIWLGILDRVDLVVFPSYKSTDAYHSELLALILKSHPYRQELKYNGLWIFSRADEDASRFQPMPNKGL